VPPPRREDQARRRLVAGYFVAALLAAAAVAAIIVVLTSDGGGADGGGPVHVHGLGVNPADDSLFIATHTGLFSSPEGADSAERVDEQFQDTMGFTVVGPDHFLASGHPAPGEARPESLGLIESTDGGRSWEEVSLSGEADFHVLRYAHDRVYAYNALSGELMLSDDGGETWTEREPPAAVIDLAVDPDDSERIVASTEDGLAVSDDDGESWRPISGGIGLLAWPSERRLYLVDGKGDVRVTSEAGDPWRSTGSIGGQPAALAAAGPRQLYAARSDGTVLRSADGGSSWELRSSP
jgi:photosystem II stability/assembly factor-like uncharacterized protein